MTASLNQNLFAAYQEHEEVSVLYELSISISFKVHSQDYHWFRSEVSEPLSFLPRIPRFGHWMWPVRYPPDRRVYHGSTEYRHTTRLPLRNVHIICQLT